MCNTGFGNSCNEDDNAVLLISAFILVRPSIFNLLLIDRLTICTSIQSWYGYTKLLFNTKNQKRHVPPVSKIIEAEVPSSLLVFHHPKLDHGLNESHQ
mmetsp:Transcript_3989/g.5925  ORF Transcript_3989/g.5925 Transcript_3989/m.5925 type:complete len:98 (-) Transcript_3989:1145-1438(-)